MKPWKSGDVTTAASGSLWSDEGINIQNEKRRCCCCCRRRKKQPKRYRLYSTNWPPITRKAHRKRALYLLSSLLRASLALVALICGILIPVTASSAESDFFIVTTAVAALSTSVFLAIGSLTDLGVWLYAPPSLQPEISPLDPYCVYGASYFKTTCCRIHRVQSFINRVIGTLNRAIIIAVAVPGTQWRWNACESQSVGGGFIGGQVHEDGAQPCTSPIVYRLQRCTFAVGYVGCLTPFITEWQWPSKIWSWYSAVGAARVTLGSISTSMSMRYSEGIWRFSMGGDDDYNQLPTTTQQQATFLFYSMLINGVMGGLSLTIGGIYSQFCVWKRSRYHLICDIVVNLVVCSFLIMAFVGSRLVWALHEYFCNYHTLHPDTTNQIVNDICVSIEARYSQDTLLTMLDLSLAMSILQTVLAIMMNWSKRWKPMEWITAEYLERVVPTDRTF